MRRAPLRRKSAGAAAGPHVLTKMLVAYVSIRQHTHTSAYVSIRPAAGPHVLTKMLVLARRWRRAMSESCRQHTSAYVSRHAEAHAAARAPHAPGVGEEVEESDERVMSRRSGAPAEKV